MTANGSPPSRQSAREIVETLHHMWVPTEYPDSPGLCTCGHLHFYRRCLSLNQVSWRFCEHSECRCRCLTRVRRNASGGQS